MARKSVREERRLQILKALDQCLLEKSFEQTSIKDISRIARVNHGVLHYYFESKEDILLHYIDYVTDYFKGQVGEFLAGLPREEMTGKEFAREVFSFVNNRITLDRNLSKIFVEIWQIAIYNEAVRMKLRQTYREWIGSLREHLEAGSPGGDEASVMCTAMVAFWEGMALLSCIFDEGEINFAQVLESFQQRILDILQEAGPGAVREGLSLKSVTRGIQEPE